MAQNVKIVDLSKTYMPGDPNSFPNNLEFTVQEDSPEKAEAIMPYEGFNFLPTSYGYRSYFGTTPALTLEALPKPCDEIITVQSDTYQNMLIALCSDGIRTATAGATTWTLAISLPDDWTTSSIYRSYTWTVIENNLYIYRQGYAKVVKVAANLTITEFTPSFLNMAGQMGIFRGNGRLCFWDSANSVAWSSAFDLTDFTPSIENMVGNSIFLGVQGRIITILPHGDGFVIYSTRSIVGVTYTSSGSLVWDAKTITSSGGITHPKAACMGQNNQEHFAFTTLGIVSIGHFNALSSQYDMKIILPELFDYLKEARSPVYLQCHAARFLYFSVLEDNYINGITSFTNVTIPTLKGPVLRLDTAGWTSEAAAPYISPKDTLQVLDSFFTEPTGLVAAIDRSVSPHNESRWMATMLVPNFKSQASQKGMFSGIDCKYKSRAYDFPVPLTLENFLPIVDAHCIQHSNGGAGGGGYTAWNSWGFYLNSILNADTLRIQNDNVRVSSAIERSIFTNLYSQELLGLETGGSSCIDLIYNFMSVVNEYRFWLKKNERNIRDMVVAINEMDYHKRVVYSDSFQTFAAPPISSASYYFPTYKGHVYADIDQGSGVTNASLAFNYTTTEYMKLNHVAAMVEKMSEETINIALTPAMYNYTLSLGGSIWVHHFDHMPTPEELVAYFGDIANGGLNAAGIFYVLDYTFSSYPNMANSGLGYSQTYCNLRRIDTGAIVSGYISARLCYDDSMNGMNTSPTSWWLSSYGSLPANIALEYLSYPYVLNFSSLLSYVYSPDPITTFMALNNYALRPTSVGQFYTMNPVSESYTLVAKALEYYWSEDGSKFYITGRIKKVSDASERDEVIAILYMNTIKKTVLRESSLYSLADVSIGSVPTANKDILQLLFSETDRDTLTKDSSGYYTRTNNTHFITPAWNDTGVDVGMTFPGVPWTAVYKNDNTAFPYSIQQCIPWDFFKNGSMTSIIHGIDPTLVRDGKLLQTAMPIGPIYCLEDNIVCYGYSGDWDGFVTLDLSDFTYPSTTFVLQNGIPVPGYPTLVGSFVMDMHLKKWGKQAASFKALLQFSPINATNNEAIPYTNFGMDSGVLDARDMKIKLFDVNPKAGFMRYGKIGFYRLGFTNMLEVRLSFRTPFTGKIVVDGSVDGRDLEIGIQHEESFTNVRSCIVNCDMEARWHTISIHGKFDLQYMEFRGKITSRR